MLALIAVTAGALMGGLENGGNNWLEWQYDTGGKIYASPVIADLDADGENEVVVAASRAQRLLCFNGTGTVRWACEVDDGDPDGLQATPSVVDLDGDERNEVLFLTHGGLAVCVDAAGRLRWRTVIDDKFDYTGPAVGDLNGDGRAEIVFGSESGTLYCLDDTGRRLWHYQGRGAIRGIPAIGPAAQAGSLYVYAAFSAGMLACFNCEGAVVWSADAPGPRGERRSSPALGDLEGDGRPEVVSATEDFQVIAQDAWTGEERWRWKGAGTIDQANSFALVDFEGTGRLDVVCGDSSGRVYRVQDGAALWAAETGGGIVQGPSVGDADGDGQLEILVCSRANGLVCISAQGEEEWAFETTAGPLATPALGDVDGDGKSDIVFTSKEGLVRCLGLGGAFNPALMPWPMLARDPQLSGNVAGVPFAPGVISKLPPTGEPLALEPIPPLHLGENRVGVKVFNGASYRRRLELTIEVTGSAGMRETYCKIAAFKPGESRREELVFGAERGGLYAVTARLSDLGTGETLAERQAQGMLEPLAVERNEVQDLLRSLKELSAALPEGTAPEIAENAGKRIELAEHLLGQSVDTVDEAALAALAREMRACAAGLRKVEACLEAGRHSVLASARFALLAETPLRKVSRAEPYPVPEQPRPFHVELARNEYETLQVVIVPQLVSTSDLRISCSGLKHEDGEAAIPAEDIEINPVGYVETAPPEYIWPVNTSRDHPDVLLPDGPVSLSSEWTAQPFFVTIRTRAATLPGRYAGLLEVSAEGKPAGEVPLAAEVWDFALPDVPNLKTSFWMSEGDIAAFYRYTGGVPAEVRRRFYDLHLKYRVSPIKDFPFEQGAALEDFEYVMNHGQNCFFLPVSDAAGAARDTFAERVRAAGGYLDGKGWSDLGAFYTMDEVAVMQRHRIADVQDMSAWLRQTFPQWPRLQTSAPEQALFGVADIWCPTIDNFDPVVLAQRMALGERLWMYTVWGRPGIMIEFPATDHRLMFWECWKYGAEGFLYWGTTHWGYNLEGEQRWPERPWITQNAQPGHNGCGYMIYPGPDATPLASLRLHAVRDGIEDYEYLHLLRGLADEEGARLPETLRRRVTRELKVDPAVVTDNKTFTEDPEAILAARRRIAELIQELNTRQGP